LRHSNEKGNPSFIFYKQNIEGVSHQTVLSIMSEFGPRGFEKFRTAKHFAAWLRLAPNNKTSGGRF